MPSTLAQIAGFHSALVQSPFGYSGRILGSAFPDQQRPIEKRKSLEFDAIDELDDTSSLGVELACFSNPAKSGYAEMAQCRPQSGPGAIPPAMLEVIEKIARNPSSTPILESLASYILAKLRQANSGSRFRGGKETSPQLGFTIGICEHLTKWSTWSEVLLLSREDVMQRTLQPATIPSRNELSRWRLDLQQCLLASIDSHFNDLVISKQKQKDSINAVMKLDVEDQVAFLNALEKRMIDTSAEKRTRRQFLRLLKRLCSVLRLLPASFRLSGTLVQPTGRPLAGGRFADVWRSTCGGRDVALKVIRVYAQSEAEVVQSKCFGEAVVWRILRHPNILPLLGVETDMFPLCFVSEWMPHGRMDHYLKEHPETNRLGFMADISRGLQYLHSADVVHGDLKGSNILVNAELQACIADFGLSCVAYDFNTTNAITQSEANSFTLRWTAPEVLLHERQPSKSSDIYSLSMVFWEIATLRPPFSDLRESAVTLKVIQGIRPERIAEFGLTDVIWNIMEMGWQGDWPSRPQAIAILAIIEREYRITKTISPNLPNVQCASTIPEPEDCDWLLTDDDAADVFGNISHACDPARSLDELALAFRDRFLQTSTRLYLDTALDLHRQALALRPMGNDRRMESLIHLGSALRMRANQYGTHEDLDESIYLLHEALSAPSSLNEREAGLSARDELAMGLSLRSQITGSDSDLDEAIALQGNLLNVGVGTMGNVAHALSIDHITLARRLRFERRGDVADLRFCLQYQELALQLINPDHQPDDLVHNYALILAHEARRTGCQPDMQRCFDTFARAVNCTERQVYQRLRSATAWLKAAESLCPDASRIGIYHQALSMLFEVYASGLEDQLHLTTEFNHLAVDAAIHAVSLSDFVQGLQLLEAGRAAFWTYSLRFRGLSKHVSGPLSATLQSIARRIEQGYHIGKLSAVELVHRDAEHRTLVREFTTTLQESPDIVTYHSWHLSEGSYLSNTKVVPAKRTSLPGVFGCVKPSWPRNSLPEQMTLQPQEDRTQQFLSQREDDCTGGQDSTILPVANLSSIASRGPVVVLLANQGKCFALALTPGKEMLRIPLLSISVEALKAIRMEMDSLISGLLGESAEYSYECGWNYVYICTSNRMKVVLARLWGGIVKPVLNGLKIQCSEGKQRPRLWWCPTGAFSALPIHAAGDYVVAGGDCCSNYVISSYTPTLGALFEARQNFVPIPVTDVNVLLAGVPTADFDYSWIDLPGTDREIDSLQKLFASNTAHRKLSEQDTMLSEHISVQSGATTQSIHDGLNTATVFHVACHGLQEQGNPMQSGFVMRDGMFTIRHLMELSGKAKFLAFLSACETAKGDFDAPDQVVHIAAAMLFAGFRSVVGTLWAIDEDDAIFVATEFYRELLENSEGELDADMVPYALQEAMSKLRQRHDHPVRWASFIHLGM